MPRRRRKRAHGQGCVYQRGPRNFWIKWREGGRARYSGGYETREIAERIRAKIVADIAAGRAGLPPDERSIPTLQALFEPWIERRRVTHRAATDDAGRWTNHLKPFFGSRRPKDVDAAGIRAFVEAKLAAGMNPATVGHCVRLLSTFFSDLMERGYVGTNPVRTVPRSTRRLMRPTADPKATPFIETAKDVRRVFLALPEPVNVAFAIGALAGLRTGEVVGLDWADVNIEAQRMHVKWQVQDGTRTGLKDDETRIVPIVDSLVPVLASWKLKTGGEGPVFKPIHTARGGRPGSPPTYLRATTLRRHLKAALKACKLPDLSWYQSTRHTFASQWVLANGSIEKLAHVMGHSSTIVTQRYAHLRTDLFQQEDLARLSVDLTPGGVVRTLGRPMKATVGYATVTEQPRGKRSKRSSS